MRKAILAMAFTVAMVACGTDENVGASGAMPAVTEGTCEPKDTPTNASQGTAGPQGPPGPPGPQGPEGPAGPTGNVDAK